MGKVSVYKFNISDSNEQMRAEQIIQQYLVDKNFIYDDKYNCYRVTNKIIPIQLMYVMDWNIVLKTIN